MSEIFRDIEKRNYGLDLFRAIAILLVVFGHGFSITGLEKYNKFIQIDGVDLFFVLSGFLIGKILLNFNYNSLRTLISESRNFLRRRWLRTLPNYFLFLLINIFLVKVGIYDGLLNINTLAYFAFLQNLFIPLDLMFWESWSLAVEEWFYLLFPISLILVYIVKSILKVKFNAYIVICVMMIITPLMLRIIFSYELSETINTDIYLRKIVIYRLDTIAYGLLTAYLFAKKEFLFVQYSNLIFLIGITGIILLKFLPIAENVFFRNTFYYSFISLFFSCLLPFFIKIRKPPNFIHKSTFFISLISYSMYLVHLPVLYLINYTYPRLSLVPEGIATFMLYFFSTLIISLFFYYVWERPFMNLRNRKTRGARMSFHLNKKL